MLPKKLDLIPGIRPDELAILNDFGIHDIDRLIEFGDGTIGGLPGIDSDKLIYIVKRAKLMQVERIGPIMLRLLDLAGIKTLEDLAALSLNIAGDLSKMIAGINQRTKLSKTNPSPKVCYKWIRHAKEIVGEQC